MICPDCEAVVDKLTTQGRCRKCSARFNQLVYKNKKDGTNKPYIPLKKQKGTEIYKRIISRRTSSTTSKIKKLNNTEKTETKQEDLKLKYYLKVKQDLDVQFEKNKISKNYLTTDLPNFIEILWELLQEDNAILDATKANKIFDDLSYLYLHNHLSIDWNNKEQILENSLYEKAVLELRRPTKEFILYWRIILPLIEAIKSNDSLMKLIEDTRTNLKEAVIKEENPLYLTEIDNDLSKIDTIKVVDKNFKYYNIKAMVRGLYGHDYAEIFKLATPMYAKDVTQAKERFIEFMAQKFSNVEYDENDIEIEETKR